MKKGLFLLLLGLLTISATACLLSGTVRKAVVTYSFPDYTAKKIITKTVVVKEPVAGFTNMSALVVQSVNPDDYIASSTSRISFSDRSLHTQFTGPIINPNTTKEHLIKGTLATSIGWVRVSGTGTFDPNTSNFSGDGNWIFWFDGSVQMSEVGKYASPSSFSYKGVGTAKIIPAAANYYTVTSGTITSAVPVSAVITVPVFAVNNSPSIP
jgi:hypothetical protein